MQLHHCRNGLATDALAEARMGWPRNGEEARPVDADSPLTPHCICFGKHCRDAEPPASHTCPAFAPQLAGTRHGSGDKLDPARLSRHRLNSSQVRSHYSPSPCRSSQFTLVQQSAVATLYSVVFSSTYYISVGVRRRAVAHIPL